MAAGIKFINGMEKTTLEDISSRGYVVVEEKLYYLPNQSTEGQIAMLVISLNPTSMGETKTFDIVTECQEVDITITVYM